MENANYIPLGSGSGAASRIKSAPKKEALAKSAEDAPNFISLGSRDRSKTGFGPERPPKVWGETKEERKRIAREVRLAAKKEKKKAKQAAKAQRKLNGILHRRMTRNDAKYVKNKDRNHQRAIDAERWAIQSGAVRQAEKLAAIHDHTGKLFNVGEMIVMPDGNVKSKDKLRELEEIKKRRAAIQADYEARVKRANDAFQAAKAELQEKCAAQGREATVAEIQRLRSQNMPPQRISKKQQARREALEPKPVPPKPVIPEGYSIPEGEEDLLALWDITDAQIVTRINRRKKEKKIAAKALRKIQKEKKKFNKAMKVLKKQCAHDGVLWDPEKAKNEVLKQMIESSDEKSEGDSDVSDDAGSGPGSDSSSDSDSDSEEEGDEKEKKPKVLDMELHLNKKLRTKEVAPEGSDEIKTKIKFKGSKPKIDLDLLAKAAEWEAAQKQKKKDAKERRKRERLEKEAKEAAEKARLEEEKKALAKEEKKANKAALEPKEAAKEESSSEKASSKKRKRVKDEDNAERVNRGSVSEKPSSKKHKSSKESAAPETNGELDGKDSSSKKRKPGKEEVEEVDEEAKAAREKRERKQARKAEKAKAKAKVQEEPEVIKPEPVEAPKKKKQKLPESDDSKLDQEIAGREAKIKSAEAVKWNPDALAGDEARKSKFMRLLGAGKNKGDGIEKFSKSSEGDKDVRKTAEEIARVQSELERQYEFGMKMKHDGGSKRRGLGA